MKEINRPYKPDEVTAEFIFQAYQLLRSAPPTISKWARQIAFENISSGAHSWRVVGISEAALRRIASTGTSAGVERGHWFPRVTRDDILFGAISTAIGRDELIEFYYEHDTTVVITKEQNNARGTTVLGARLSRCPRAYSRRKATLLPCARKPNCLGSPPSSMD